MDKARHPLIDNEPTPAAFVDGPVSLCFANS